MIIEKCEQVRVLELECGKDAQTSLAVAYNVHNSVSLVSNDVSLVSNMIILMRNRGMIIICERKR